VRVCDGKLDERGAKRQGRSVSNTGDHGRRDEVPGAQYAYLGDDRIAHRVFREGDVDLIHDRAVAGWASGCPRLPRVMRCGRGGNTRNEVRQGR
jgi:hypothetical protein